jgi:hypothetical protein
MFSHDAGLVRRPAMSSDIQDRTRTAVEGNEANTSTHALEPTSQNDLLILWSQLLNYHETYDQRSVILFRNLRVLQGSKVSGNR